MDLTVIDDADIAMANKKIALIENPEIKKIEKEIISEWNKRVKKIKSDIIPDKMHQIDIKYENYDEYSSTNLFARKILETITKKFPKSFLVCAISTAFDIRHLKSYKLNNSSSYKYLYEDDEEETFLKISMEDLSHEISWGNPFAWLGISWDALFNLNAFQCHIMSIHVIF